MFYLQQTWNNGKLNGKHPIGKNNLAQKKYIDFVYLKILNFLGGNWKRLVRYSSLVPLHNRMWSNGFSIMVLTGTTARFRLDRIHLYVLKIIYNCVVI